jgi:hypothetical protein
MVAWRPRIEPEVAEEVMAIDVDQGLRVVFGKTGA